MASGAQCLTCGRVHGGDFEHCPYDGTALQPVQSPDDPLIGKTVDGRFTIVERLGEGGMGAVYRARQHSVERDVALKVMRPEFATGSTASRRFLREARATSRLTHHNTITIHDFGEDDDGLLYIAMELLEGRTLGDLLETAPVLNPGRAVRIALQIADSLHEAHERDLVHRDLKPANVMLVPRRGQPDFVKVLDFGIARLLNDEGQTTLTAKGAVPGTAMYMSPEAAMGIEVDARSDIYALGLILFEMVCGRPPFSGSSAVALLMAHARTKPPDPASIQAAVSAGLAAVITRMLAKQRADRPQSTDEVCRLLEPFRPADPSSFEIEAVDEVALADTAAGCSPTEPSSPVPTEPSSPVPTDTWDVNPALREAATPKRARPWPWIAVAAIGIAAGGLGVHAWTTSEPDAPSAPAPDPVVAAPAPAPAAAPAVVVEPPAPPPPSEVVRAAASPLIRAHPPESSVRRPRLSEIAVPAPKPVTKPPKKPRRAPRRLPGFR